MTVSATQEAPGTERVGSPAGWRLVELAGTSGLAVAQPVLDIYAQNTLEFIVRGVDGWELVAFALVVLFAPALLALGVEQAVGLWSVPWRERLHRLLVTSFVGLFIIQLMPPGPAGLIALVVAGLVGYLFWTGWGRSPAVRNWTRFLVIAPIMFGALFVTNSDVWSLIVLEPPEPVEASSASEPPSILFVVFDELPTASLLDAEGGIDADRYPAFAGLAAQSTWYRNHTTIASWTSSAVPGALTGIYPDVPSNRAHWTTHPENLFRLLGSSHHIEAQETATNLCPPTVCPESGSAGSLIEMTQSAAGTWVDVASPYKEAEVDFDLIGGGVAKAASADALSASAEAIVETPDPVFSYVHVSLPHQPWTYLPTGASYEAPSPPAGRVDGAWADPMIAGSARQRHLLQLEYTDRLLGDTLDRLAASDRLDDTLVVVMGDHGVAFSEGADHRAMSTDNLEQIAYTPLLIKAPGQREGVVDDQFVQTVDIVPTIADLVGVDIPWPVDGVALGDDDVPSDRDPRYYPIWLDDLPSPADGDHFISLGRTPVTDRLREAGWRPGSEAVWQIATEVDLADREVSSYEVTRPGAVTAELERRDGGEVPAYFELQFSEPVDDDLAIAIDGEIVLLGRAGSDGQDRFWATLPEPAATDRAPLEVYLVRATDAGPTLTPVELRD